MATLYQLHSTIDNLHPSCDKLALTWRRGDRIILLGAAAAYLDWLQAYLDDSDVTEVAGIYALASDITKLAVSSTDKLKLDTKLTAILTDEQWVNMTQDKQFDKVVTIA